MTLTKMIEEMAAANPPSPRPPRPAIERPAAPPRGCCERWMFLPGPAAVRDGSRRLQVRGFVRHRVKGEDGSFAPSRCRKKQPSGRSYGWIEDKEKTLPACCDCGEDLEVWRVVRAPRAAAAPAWALKFQGPEAMAREVFATLAVGLRQGGLRLLRPGEPLATADRVFTDGLWAPNLRRQW